ncbi:hypothetical protein DLJ54_04830 [Corynebacterium heidelbergense]|uniref:Uncharacterized protein n=1 Tax=Corynebacterium heidelbergense TaxID=2055947 RepID=A0A364V686_9CORY|nr:hypothetical protein DLJ54_04830 [Corynebacterium heidelbergense]
MPCDVLTQHVAAIAHDGVQMAAGALHTVIDVAASAMCPPDLGAVAGPGMTPPPPEVCPPPGAEATATGGVTAAGAVGGSAATGSFGAGGFIEADLAGGHFQAGGALDVQWGSGGAGECPVPSEEAPDCPPDAAPAEVDADKEAAGDHADSCAEPEAPGPSPEAEVVEEAEQPAGDTSACQGFDKSKHPSVPDGAVAAPVCSEPQEQPATAASGSSSTATATSSPDPSSSGWEPDIWVTSPDTFDPPTPEGAPAPEAPAAPVGQPVTDIHLQRSEEW